MKFNRIEIKNYFVFLSIKANVPKTSFEEIDIRTTIDTFEFLQLRNIKECIIINGF